MSKPNILVVGSSNTDMILRLPRIPQPGETILGGEFMTAPGGKGANQAVGAARAGGAVTLVARVGRDLLGDQAISGFRRDGLDVNYVFRDPIRPSGVALIFVARNGQNSIAVAPGANGGLSPADVRRAIPAFVRARAVLLQLEIPLDTVQAAVDQAAAHQAQVILNPAPATPLPARLLKRISCLTPNESEAELLTGIKVRTRASAGKAARALLGRGVPMVVLTLGARGALVATSDRQTFVPGFPVRAVDTTAAGDVFNGALAVALAEGKSLPEAARFANAAGALSVTRAGAQPSAPRRAAIERLCGRIKGLRKSRRA